MSEAVAILQRLLPQHALSRLAGRLADSRTAWIKRPLIHGFARWYGVDMTEAQRGSLDDYACFNEFFTRALRPEVRPVDADPLSVVSPADGVISQSGRLDGGRLLQAKGTSYPLDSLVGESAPGFHGGSFVTVYLAPRDYHRVHAPADATLTATTAIPGQLYSVSARTEAAVSDLFCRNERLVCRFDTGHGGVLMVLVGALIVASIQTVWGGPRSPYRRVQRDAWRQHFRRGDEIGRFLLGSTVIVCCEPGRMRWDPRVRPGQRLRMGERLGQLVE